MEAYPEKFRDTKSLLIVTKPTGEVVQREVVMYWDSTLNTIGIRFIGDSPLKGYSFELAVTEIGRVMQEGRWTPTVMSA